jgi:hypothetical protein
MCPLSLFPPLQNLASFPNFLRHSHGKPFLFCDVLKTVPGLPQSGLLSQLRLVALLTQHGYSETSTPMLFRHHTHSTAFSLVVDDFLVRYSHPSELDHLVSCLASLYYELKVHRDLPHYTYLGYTVDYPHLTLTLHVPLYAKLYPRHAVSSLSFGVWVSFIPCHLHPTCTLPRPLISHHPLHPSLSHRNDLDPTSCWVPALLRESARSFYSYCCLPTLFSPVKPHAP